jgi:hypothetical protein
MANSCQPSPDVRLRIRYWFGWARSCSVSHRAAGTCISSPWSAQAYLRERAVKDYVRNYRATVLSLDAFRGYCICS